jgi:hypothetical protein
VRGEALSLHVADVRNEQLRCQIAYRNPTEIGRGVIAQCKFVLLQCAGAALACLHQRVEVVEKQINEIGEKNVGRSCRVARGSLRVQERSERGLDVS